MVDNVRLVSLKFESGSTDTKHTERVVTNYVETVCKRNKGIPRLMSADNKYDLLILVSIHSTRAKLFECCITLVIRNEASLI